MSRAILQMYKSAGVKAPDGKGVHTTAFHRMAISIKKANPSYSMNRCYSIAMARLGRESAVKKAHRQPAKVYSKQKRQRDKTKTKRR